MSAALIHAGLPEGIGRNDFRRIVEVALRKVFGLPDLAVAVMAEVFDRTQAQDFQSGHICGSWISTASLAERLGRSERQINATEQLLEEHGLIERTNGRGRRHGVRKGVIVHLRGISLAPLIRRADEIIASVEEYRATKAKLHDALRASREEIRDLRKAIRDSEDFDAIRRAETILPRGRTSRIRDLDQLEELAAALSAIAEAVRLCVGERKTAHRSAGNRAPNTTPQAIPESCSEGTRGPDEGSQVSLRQALAVATPSFRSVYAMQSGGALRRLEDASRTTAFMHGISRSVWDRMCRDWGPQRASLAVILIDRNAHLPEGHRWRANSVAKCFGGMAKNPTNLERMFHAVIRTAGDSFVERQFRPEPHGEDTRGQLGTIASAILAKLQKGEGCHVPS